MPPGLLPNFFQAARFRDAAILQACLESGIGVNVQDSFGDTALHYLFAVGCFCNNCVGNLTNCLEILLRHKANPNVENMKGQVPLDLVIENFVPIEFAKLLVDNGARVVYEEGIVNRTLMKELIKQLPETVYEMLDKGVNLIPDPRPTNVVQLNFGNLVYKKPDENVADVSGGQWKESEFLFDIVQNSTPEGKQRILTHPLIKAFLSLKSPKYWLSFGGFYCVWITVTFILYLTFIWTVYNGTCIYSRNATSTGSNVLEYDERNSICNVGIFESVLAYIVLILYLLGPVGLEVMEFRVMGWRVYSQQWTNYIFLPASALVMVTLFPALGGKRSYTLNWEYPTAAVGMLVGSVLIMIQMNPVPFVALYLEMLFKTFQRIMIAVLIFSPLFLGFFFSFRILITKEDIGWFQLMTMIVGDSNYEDMMDEGRGYFYEVVAYFFFAAFIFLVIIVVLNLLIGLAVSDVQKLKAYAHVTHLGNQVRSFYVADAFYGMGRRSFVTTKRWTYELRHSNSESTKGLSNALKMELLQLARKRGCSDLGRMEFNKSTHRAVNTVIIPQYRWNGPMAPGPLNRINHNYY